MGTLSSIEIANYFIKKAKESGGDLTPIKLIKLVFIAQGIFLAVNNRLLFKEQVEAWKYGPVIPDLYHAFKNYGNQNIDSYAGRAIIQENGEPVPDLPKEKKICELLDAVWAYFSSWTGIELSAWTHRKGSAWDIAYNKQGGAAQPGFPIDPLLIQAEFEPLVEKSS